jgi:hypothetical protein
VVAKTDRATTEKAGAGTKKAAPKKLALVKKPWVSGSRRVGGKLTVSAGTWSVKPASIAYQWLRDGKPIAGATHASYTVARADAGASLSVRLTASAPGHGKVTVTSAKVRLAS